MTKDANGVSDFEGRLSKELVEALRKRQSRKSLDQRIESWWLWQGRTLVAALKGTKDRSPGFLEALAVMSGDLVFDEEGLATISDEFAGVLAASCQKSSAEYRLAKCICINNLALGKLQSELQPIAALIISTEWREPRPGKGHASKNWHRDLLIVRGVNSTSPYGIAATRNEVSETTSGCDLVIEAFKKAGRSDAPTYPSVKKVWQRRDALLKDDKDLDLINYQISVED